MFKYLDFCSIIYLLGISFQCVGALLCFTSITTGRDRVIKNFFSKSRFTAENGDTHKIFCREEAFKNEWESAYQNKLGFGLIALGYLLSFFPISVEIGTFCKILIFVFLVILLFFLFKWIVAKYTNKKCKNEIDKNDLDRLNIETDVCTMSKEDIDEIFDKNK